MLVAYFTLAGLLAAAALYVGLVKLVRSKTQITSMGGPMAWTADLPAWQIKAIASVEVLAALGLILPMALSAAPVLSPISAIALGLTHLGALRTHRRKHASITSDVVVLALTGVTALLGFLLAAGT